MYVCMYDCMPADMVPAHANSTAVDQDAKSLGNGNANPSQRLLVCPTVIIFHDCVPDAGTPSGQSLDLAKTLVAQVGRGFWLFFLSLTVTARRFRCLSKTLPPHCTTFLKWRHHFQLLTQFAAKATLACAYTTRNQPFSSSSLCAELTVLKTFLGMLLRLLPVDTPGVHIDSTLESDRDTPAVVGQVSTRDQLLRLYDTVIGWVQPTTP